MKLLFFVEHFSLSGSGAENDAVNLCRALAERGHEVHVCCEDGENFDKIQLHELSKADQVIAEVKPDKTIDWGFFHQADLYRVGGGIHQEYLKHYLNSFPKSIQWFKKLEFKFKSKHRKRIAFEQSFLQNTDSHFSCISNLVANQISNSGIEKKQISVDYNLVDRNQFCPQSEATRETQRQMWNLQNDDLVGLFIAHNLQLKNLKLLIAVYDRLTTKFPQLKLVVCGKRKPKQKRPYLIYAGTTPSLENFYAASDFLLHPTFYDSFANVVPEAMACGKVVLVSDQAGAAEQIKDGKNGFVLPVTLKNSEEIWSNKLSELLKSESLRNQIGNEAKVASTSTYGDFVTQFEKHLTDPKTV